MAQNTLPQEPIRAAKNTDYPRLVEIWRAAVKATHHFLDEAYFNYIEAHLAQDYFPNVTLEVFTTPKNGGRAENCAAFMGYALQGEVLRLEMLFVAPAFQRQGIGAAMLQHAKSLSRNILLDVNEQNTSALAFYQKQGFSIIGRSALDGCGKPYPLLHLKYEQSE